MTQNHKMIRSLMTNVTFAGASLVAASSYAGTAIVSMEGGGDVTYEYSKSALRMGTPTEPSYSVVRDGKMYAVMYEGEQPTVIDASSVLKGFASTMGQDATSSLTAEILEMKDTGKTEVVAGVSGRIYRVTVRDGKGVESVEDVVLSSDARAREFTDALFLMTSMSSSVGGEEALKAAQDMKKRLDAEGLGFLRFGDEMKITSINSDPVPADRFELPAEPVDMSGMGALLGNMSKSANDTADQSATSDSEPSQGGGGLIGSVMGAISKKVDRQADRAAGTVEGEIDSETDEAVDKGIGKALGKLFGN
ncbi:MAG: hypothetical protein AAGG55_02820 [Pseudomonadota bacterium]